MKSFFTTVLSLLRRKLVRFNRKPRRYSKTPDRAVSSLNSLTLSEIKLKFIVVSKITIRFLNGFLSYGHYWKINFKLIKSGGANV